MKPSLLRFGWAIVVFAAVNFPGSAFAGSSYNAQNRPIQVKQGGTVRENYTYDHQGRRTQKGDILTLYDGYNAIAEYSLHTRILKTTYAWGNDLSGTLQGAGGVGGLLSVKDHTTQIPVTSYPTYDGNSNITEYLTEENSGTMAAHYEYDAFGNVARKTGNKEFAYQFSTKPYDSFTGLNYYNYRNYDPNVGRWINRDPIEEEGGMNLYYFNRNNILKIDYFGLKTIQCPSDIKQKGKDFEKSKKKLAEESAKSGEISGLDAIFTLGTYTSSVENVNARTVEGPTVDCDCSGNKKTYKMKIKFQVYYNIVRKYVGVKKQVVERSVPKLYEEGPHSF